MDVAYQKEIEEWRQALDTMLKRRNSWLALAGLFWLHQGSNSFGTDPANDIVLPPGSAPSVVGDFLFSGGATKIMVSSDTPVKINGNFIHETDLQPDIPGPASIVELNDLQMIVIKRGDRYGIRLWDNNRPAQKDFSGRSWYPIQEMYQVTARYLPHEPVPMLTLPSASGDIQKMPGVGAVLLNLFGQESRLEALEGPAGGLFIIFKDLTNGEGTYPAGRYLATDTPQQGRVNVDFNRAYNPPCAFTEYATCALPPAENQLNIGIEAGERYQKIVA
jgi:uncharacterized protein (DUF1684 family)